MLKFLKNLQNSEAVSGELFEGILEGTPARIFERISEGISEVILIIPMPVEILGRTLEYICMEIFE